MSALHIAHHTNLTLQILAHIIKFLCLIKRIDLRVGCVDERMRNLCRCLLLRCSVFKTLALIVLIISRLAIDKTIEFVDVFFLGLQLSLQVSDLFGNSLIFLFELLVLRFKIFTLAAQLFLRLSKILDFFFETLVDSFLRF